jgi:hypothetical protein
MTKITTADCKQFLVAKITKNPEIILDIYEGFNEPDNLLPTALIEKKWVRREKFKPTSDHDFANTEYDLWYPVRGPGRGSVPADSLATVRVFSLEPNEFDDAVRFMVLEDKTGQLLLGEYIGD